MEREKGRVSHSGRNKPGGLEWLPHQDEPPAPAPLPETALLYSVDDVARMARVTRVAVVRLCLSGQMPPWKYIDGRRYWDRTGANHAAHIAFERRGLDAA